MLFWVYFFTIIIMEYLSDQFSDEDITCTELSRCFVYIINYGVRWGEGIGEWFKVPAPGSTTFHIITVTQTFFWLIVNLLF